MHTTSSSRALVVLIAGAGVSVLASGTAFAYWTTVGGGTGTAAATRSVDLTTGRAVVASGLHPGGSADGRLAVTNPNPFSVLITSATFAAATTTTPACVTTGVTFAVTRPPSPEAPLVIAPKGTVQVPYRVSMSNASDDGCQGATFSSVLRLSGTS